MLLKGALILFVLIFHACQEKRDNKNSAVNFNLGGEPTTINPITSTDWYATELHKYILDRLMIRDLDTYEWKSALAESFTVSPDKKKFTFKIRPNVKWHDGTLLTAEDIKFSFDVIFDPKYNTASKRPYYENIEKAEVIDPQTIVFTAKDDYFGNFDVIAGELFILSKAFYSNPGNTKEMNKNLIGTGPFRLIKYEKGKRFVLEKNKDWWGINVDHTKEMYLFNKLNLRFVSETQVAIEMLKKGDLDFVSMTAEDYMKKTEGEIWNTKLEKVQVVNKAPKGYNFIGWNLAHPILKDREVRKALSMLFNRNLMLEKFEYNLPEPAVSPIYLQSDYAPKGLKPVPYDPQAALDILKKQGWKDTDGDQILDKMIGKEKMKLSFTILEPAEQMVKYLTVYKEDAQKVGVEFNIKIVEWNSFVKLLEERKFDALRLAWGPPGVDMDLKQIWHSSSSKGGSNFISYHNPEVDKLIDQSRKEYDRNKRIPMLQKIATLIAEDYPYVFYFSPKFSMYGNNRRIWKPKESFNYALGASYWKLKE